MRIFRKLAQLLDVEIVSPVDNDRLQYEAASGKWKNTSVSGVAPHHASHEEGGTDEVSVTVGMIDAEASTDGQVPTSDGAGGVTWEDQVGGGGGAPTDVNYLVGTASGDLSAEIVVGTAPGGELGGTWASPTVDATHSGSSHAGVQAAAEATAAAALSSHESDTTNVHGIADTSALLDSSDIGSTVQAYDADLDTYAGITPSANVQSILGAADYAAIRTLLDLVIGTNVQAFDADLSTWAGLTPSSFFQSLVDDSDAATARATLGVIASLFENGGGQELSVAGLSGELADGQPSKSRGVSLIVSDPNGDDLATGDGQAYWAVPALMDGMNLTAVQAHLTTAGTTTGVEVQVHNVTQAADMLSTALTTDAADKDSKDATTPAVIDTDNDDVASGDELRIDVDEVPTGGKGLIVALTFEAP